MSKSIKIVLSILIAYILHDSLVFGITRSLNNIPLRIRHIRTKEKVVALTIDDGPSILTEEFLKMLKEQEVKATFFLVGERIQRRPHLIKMIMEDGHEIGNHSWSHLDDFGKQPIAIMHQEIIKADTLIKEMGYLKDTFFRSPHGSESESLYSVLKELNKSNILWNTNGGDWLDISIDAMIERIYSRLKPGSIILMHEGPNSANSIRVINRIIQELKEQGYQFLTISELLAYR